MSKFTQDDIVNLICISEDDKLAKKLLTVYENQLKQDWLKSLHKPVPLDTPEQVSIYLRDTEETNKL